MTLSLNNSNCPDNSKWHKIVPLILWLLIIFIPTLIGKKLVTESINSAHKAKVFQLKNQLLLEANSLKKNLDPENFFNKQIEFSQLWQHYEKSLKASNKNHPFFKVPLIKEILALSSYDNNYLNKIKRIFRNRNLEPQIIIKLGHKTKLHKIYSAPAYKPDLSNFDTKASLQRIYNQVYRYYKERGKTPADYNLIKEHPFIKKIFGNIQELSAKDFDQRVRYSTTYNTVFFILNLPILKENQPPQFLISAFYRNKMNPYKILVHNHESLKKKQIDIKIGYSKNPNLPIFKNTENEISLIVDFPINFAMLFPRSIFQQKQKFPAIKLSMKKKEMLTTYKEKAQVKLFTNLWIILSLIFLIGLMLEKFKLSSSLWQTTRIALLAGLILPVSGIFWIGYSSWKAYKKTEENKIYHLIEEKIDSTLEFAILQKNREKFVINLVLDIITTMNWEERFKFLKRFQLSARNNKNNIRKFILSYYLISPQGTAYFDHIRKYKDGGREVNTIMKGPLFQALIRLNAFSSLAQKMQNKIKQTMEFSLGLIEQNVDLRMLPELFATPGKETPFSFLTNREGMTVKFLNNKNKKPEGLIAFSSSSDHWFDYFFRVLENTPYYSKFENSDYYFSIHMFQRSPIKPRTLDTNHFSHKYSKLASKLNIPNLAAGLFANSDEIRINNLSSKIPYIATTKTSPDRSLFALAIAVPKENNSKRIKIFFISILIVGAILICIFLANFSTSTLLSEIPPFLKALEALQKGDYSWEIKLHSQDEFQELSSAFNEMRLSLLEREKMSKLVSQNVLNAISSTEINLKPSGEVVSASILFCDIRSFTTITEQNQPEEIIEMLNDYFTLMTHIIEKHGGFVDKLIGDAIQAVFFENQSEPSATRAVSAAIEMHKALKEFNQLRREDQKFEIANGFGVTTGQVISGSIGSQTGKLDATVIGPPLSLAIEIEGLSKFAKEKPLLIDKNTEVIISRQFSTVQFKTGNKLDTEIFEVLG